MYLLLTVDCVCLFFKVNNNHKPFNIMFYLILSKNVCSQFPDARPRPRGQVLCVMTHANVLYNNFKYSNVHQITTQLYISTLTYLCKRQ